MSLTLTLDRPYPFDILFYERKDPSELLCLILRPEGQFMLLKKDDVSGLWQHLSGNNDDQHLSKRSWNKLETWCPACLRLRLSARGRTWRLNFVRSLKIRPGSPVMRIFYLRFATALTNAVRLVKQTPIMTDQ